jgi:3-deoxy-D-manno-octulosonic-acid transferase
LKYLYTIGIYVYALLVQLAKVIGNKKANAFITGRQDWESRLRHKFTNTKTIWIHCASLGEYELAIPLINKLSQQYSEHRLLLTFFSPSGYLNYKPNANIYHVDYLPLDTNYNAQTFINIIKPQMVLFSKYDFWYYYLRILKTNHIPTYLFSARFRQEQVFFKFYGGWYKKMLHCFTTIFVVDENSKELLLQNNVKQVMVSGDCRYDRVIQITKEQISFPEIETFKQDSLLLVVGSSWPEDETVIKPYILNTPELKVIIAPHDISEKHILEIENKFQIPSIRYSQFSTYKNERLLIIDNIGLLSRIYKYADIAYVGGAFKQGLHNILEPLAHFKPVITGPDIKKYPEANYFNSISSCFQICEEEEFTQQMQQLTTVEARNHIKDQLEKEFNLHHGASTKIAQNLKPQQS